MVIFHSYVKLPEGRYEQIWNFSDEVGSSWPKNNKKQLIYQNRGLPKDLTTKNIPRCRGHSRTQGLRNGHIQRYGFTQEQTGAQPKTLGISRVMNVNKHVNCHPSIMLYSMSSNNAPWVLVTSKLSWILCSFWCPHYFLAMAISPWLWTNYDPKSDVFSHDLVKVSLCSPSTTSNLVNLVNLVIKNSWAISRKLHS